MGMCNLTWPEADRMLANESIFNNIPIIGELIIGREDEGIFGINYRANGSWDDIETSVNPFSAFTPGFLRRIFDFLDRPEIN